MKKSLLMLCFLFSLGISQSSKSENKILISDFCELVHERRYFLLRLEKIISILKQSQRKAQEISITFNESSTFKNRDITQVMRSIETKKSLVPLFNCWNDIINYKNIKDERYIKEFTKLTLLVTKKLCHANQRTLFPTQPTEVALNLNGSYTEAITVRSYYVNRIKKPLLLLSKIKCIKEDIFEKVEHPAYCCVFETKIPFKHRATKKCIAKMEKESCLSPLLALFEEFKSYKFIQDKQFTKEFLLLVFSTYKNLLTNNASHRKLHINKSTLEAIAHLYENLESLPLENILEAIDLLTEELPQLLEHYNEFSALHWKERLKKYWWIPPALIFFFKFILIFRDPFRPTTHSGA